MLITLSGLSGCGKSTAAKLASKELGIPTIDIGVVFRTMAAEHSMDVLAFGEYVAEHPKIDRELDDRMLAAALAQPESILQGRLSGWMTRLRGIPALRIWMDASPEVRASRVASREGKSAEQCLVELKARDEANRARYLTTYGLDVNDISIYDVVIRTDTLGIQEVTDALVKAIKTYVRRTPEQPTGSG